MVPKRCGENVGKTIEKPSQNAFCEGFLYPEPRPIYEVLSSHSARKAFAGNMYKNVKDPNPICALTGHKEGSKAFNRYRMIDEETNRQTMSYLE